MDPPFIELWGLETVSSLLNVILYFFFFSKIFSLLFSIKTCFNQTNKRTFNFLKPIFFNLNLFFSLKRYIKQPERINIYYFNKLIFLYFI
uniref:Uncharacterized protein n=1 Tax=Meloidogyne enterolobii TaxID=390850 RepID=A0A6V7TSX6_MELEN|nr:unnamed protein product [Meloidogyne enterolobii]